MANLAYVKTRATCPHCAYVLDDMISFQWGLCPSSQPLDGYLYHLGDSIKWRHNADGTIPSWTYFKDGEANIGDPAFTTLAVTDIGHWTRGNCTNCGHPIGGGVVEIDQEKIIVARLFTEGEYPNDADVFMINSDHQLLPMMEWLDHSMGFQ